MGGDQSPVFEEMNSHSEMVRFPADDLYSPDAFRSSIGGYQRALHKQLSLLPNVQIMFDAGQSPDKWDADLVVVATGTSGEKADPPNLVTQTAPLSREELTTYAETGVEIQEAHQFPQKGFYRENQYSPGSSPPFCHKRFHVSPPEDLHPLISSLRDTLSLSDQQHAQVDSACQAERVAYVYHMRGRQMNEQTPIPGVLKTSFFTIVPTMLQNPFLPPKNGEPAYAFIGDRSGQVHFVGGYGQSKAARESHILSQYVRAISILNELERRLESHPEKQSELRQLLTEITAHKHRHIVEIYFWTCIVDALYCMEEKNGNVRPV